MYIVITSLIIPFLFLDLCVYALVLSFIVALVLHMRSAYCFIAWFPGIVLVGFLLAEVRPLTILFKRFKKALNLLKALLSIVAKLEVRKLKVILNKGLQRRTML